MGRELKIILANESQTLLLGKKLASMLCGGEFIAFFGDLGAGKTTLVRGLAAELGIDSIASPTFNIVRHHENGRLTLDHFDCYRLSDYEELLAIGFDDYLSSGSVIVMEWCENVEEALPPERLEIHISGSGNDVREVRIIPFGAEYAKFTEGSRLELK